MHVPSISITDISKTSGLSGQAKCINSNLLLCNVLDTLQRPNFYNSVSLSLSQKKKSSL